MLLLGGDPQETEDVWRARASVPGEIGTVLAALTEPELIAEWAPVGFELENPQATALHAGSHERVCGSIAGVKAFFDVDVACAEPGRLELVADGPLAMDVAWRFRAQRGRVVVDASIVLRHRGGLTAKILRGALVAVLNAGALDRALLRLGESLRPEGEPEPLAA
ncbi:MAG TPA: hypothetical protein VNV44_01070 [Solirubrobacteraceae bacterium]|jgi:hypothetical protein|nr:hypothetical protein [Solirubrobacteraceae bacterium]